MTNCYICNSDRSIQMHHVQMQSAGGAEGPTIPLCGTCHDLVHTIALNLESKKKDIRIPYSDKEWERARNVVKYIQLSIRKNRNNPDFNNPGKLQITLTKREIFLLHLMKKDAGKTNLNHYIRDLIRNMIRTRYPGG